MTESLAAEAVRLATKSSDRREFGHGLATMALIRTDQQDFQEAIQAIVEVLAQQGNHKAVASLLGDLDPDHRAAAAARGGRG